MSAVPSPSAVCPSSGETGADADKGNFSAGSGRWSLQAETASPCFGHCYCKDPGHEVREMGGRQCVTITAKQGSTRMSHT